MENKRIHGYTEEMKKAAAKKWAERFLESEDGIKWKEEADKQFKDYVILGKRTEYLDEGLIDEILNLKFDSKGKIIELTESDDKAVDYILESYKMSPKEIIEKFKHLLSEDEIKHLENNGN